MPSLQNVICCCSVLLAIIVSLYSELVLIIQTVKLVDLIEVRKTDCFGETRLVPHVP